MLFFNFDRFRSDYASDFEGVIFLLKIDWKLNLSILITINAAKNFNGSEPGVAIKTVAYEKKPVQHRSLLMTHCTDLKVGWIPRLCCNHPVSCPESVLLDETLRIHGIHKPHSRVQRRTILNDLSRVWNTPKLVSTHHFVLFEHDWAWAEFDIGLPGFCSRDRESKFDRVIL